MSWIESNIHVMRIRCDICGEIIRVPRNSALKGLSLIKYLKEHLENQGWFDNAEKDLNYCPECKERKNVLEHKETD